MAQAKDAAAIIREGAYKDVPLNLSGGKVVIRIQRILPEDFVEIGDIPVPDGLMGEAKPTKKVRAKFAREAQAAIREKARQEGAMLWVGRAISKAVVGIVTGTTCTPVKAVCGNVIPGEGEFHVKNLGNEAYILFAAVIEHSEVNIDVGPFLKFAKPRAA